MIRDPGVIGLAATGIMLGVILVVQLFAQRGGGTDLNVTDDWTPGPDVRPNTPALTSLVPYTEEMVRSNLDADESLVGFARAFFVPPRARDYKFGNGIEKLPLIVAATSRRILMFEVTVLRVHRTSFIPYDDVAWMSPPKPGPFGTSGRMRFGLKNGREYQFGFHGPLLSAEGMRQEQNLAEHFRAIAFRFASSRDSGSSPDRAAA